MILPLVRYRGEKIAERMLEVCLRMECLLKLFDHLAHSRRHRCPVAGTKVPLRVHRLVRGTKPKLRARCFLNSLEICRLEEFLWLRPQLHSKKTAGREVCSSRPGQFRGFSSAQKITLKPNSSERGAPSANTPEPSPTRFERLPRVVPFKVPAVPFKMPLSGWLGESKFWRLKRL